MKGIGRQEAEKREGKKGLTRKYGHVEVKQREIKGDRKKEQYMEEVDKREGDKVKGWDREI